MRYRLRTLFLPLALLTLCTACADNGAMNTKIAALEPMAQTAPVSWEQAVAATTTVRVNNTSLIFMR